MEDKTLKVFNFLVFNPIIVKSKKLFLRFIE